LALQHIKRKTVYSWGLDVKACIPIYGKIKNEEIYMKTNSLSKVGEWEEKRKKNGNVIYYKSSLYRLLK